MPLKSININKHLHSYEWRFMSERFATIIKRSMEEKDNKYKLVQ